MAVARLTLDGKVAAYEAGFRDGDTFYVYLRAFSPELAVFGPGNVLTEHMLRSCAENGVSRYDMMAPRSRNKSEWQTGEVAVLDFVLPLTPAGSFYIQTVTKRLGPALRTAFYALPTHLRSALAGLTISP
jgi:CelD/BcsL family acetyltransferase involved in cellulose biosynthesis